MQHQSIFVFDIETIPDTDVVQHLVDTKSKSVKKLREELEQYHVNMSGNPFPRQPFHKVVAVSFVEAEIIRKSNGQESYKLTDVRSGGNEESSEEEIIKGFYQYLSKKTPRIVSYNGRTFDLPVMKYRAMKYGVSAPWLYKTGDKWNNYMQRYSLDWHCDLLESFSDYGASARVKMNEVCSILGVPGKIGVDGSKVTDLYDKGDIKAIRDYCETDVLNTYLLYLHDQYHRGTLSKKCLNESVEDLVEYLDKNKDKKEKAHFDEFLEEWRKVDEGRFFK